MVTANNSTSLSAEARRELILRQLTRDGFASVRTLQDHLGVSDMTVRRDLKRLQSEGSVKVVHGGASLPRTEDYARRGRSAQLAKIAIAKRAVSLIPPGAAIILDAGTTVAAVAEHLPGDFDGYVITHSLPVLNTLVDTDIATHCLGGGLLSQRLALAGPTTVENLAKIYAEMAFMGTASISADGIFVAKDLERSAKLAFLKAAKKVIVLADHTKFDRQAPLRLAGLDVIHMVVTDREPPLATRKALEAAGVEVQLAQ